MRSKHKILIACLEQCQAHNKPPVWANLFSRIVLVGVLFFDDDPSHTQGSLQSHHSGSFPWGTGARRRSFRKEIVGICGQRSLETCSGLSQRQLCADSGTEAELEEVLVALRYRFVNLSTTQERAEQEAKWRPIAACWVAYGIPQRCPRFLRDCFLGFVQE